MLIYATVDDLATWLADTDQEVPPNAAALLRSASFLVANAVQESLYDAATITNQPKQDATCAQVAAWVLTGITPGTSGLSSTQLIKSKSIDGASVDYDTSLNASVTAFQVRQGLADGLCAESLAILNAAQLLWVATPQWSAVPDPGQFVNELGEVTYNTPLWPYVW